jgi:hypothetical protein
MFEAAQERATPFRALREVCTVRCLFAVNANADRFVGIVKWWELRRIPYNGILLILGICSTYIYWHLFDRYAPDPADDGIFPGLMPIFVGLAANIFYTAGWIVEGLVRAVRHRGSLSLRRSLFVLGFAFSVLVVSFPACAAMLNTYFMHQAHLTHWRY